MCFTEARGRMGHAALPVLPVLFLMSACGSGVENPKSTTGTPPSAEEQAAVRSAKHSRYILKDLGTLGGPLSNVTTGTQVINDKGIVVGGADTSIPNPCTEPFLCSDDFISHAFKWQDGVMRDLGALPGGTNSFATELNSHGLIAGISSNGLLNPFTGIEAFVATAWNDGKVIDLGTLGGSSSLPDGINERGQVVGVAQNTVTDPVYLADLIGFPSGTQWRAALWEDGVIRDLGTLGTGQEAFAVSINERGQIAGYSFTNTTPNPTTGFPTVAGFSWQDSKMHELGSLGGTLSFVFKNNNRGQVAGSSYLPGDVAYHAVLWTKGKATDLGILGGNNSQAVWLNDRGDVAGTSDTADGTFDAFLWRDGVMTDLGRVAGDNCSLANYINSKGEVVGQSACRADGVSHAFISENGGPAIDLNTLVSPGSGLRLVEAEYISDRGEVAGLALLPNGDAHAFLLIPRDRHNDDELDGAASPSPDGAVAAGQGATSASWRGLTAKAPAASLAPDVYRSRLVRFRPGTLTR
jgi:probable HAF family extracellular repeat protein